MTRQAIKAASAANAAGAAMTSPTQTERLEAVFQAAAYGELPYAEFLEQVLGKEVLARTNRNIAVRSTSMNRRS